MGQRKSFFEEKRLYDPSFTKSKDCMDQVRQNTKRIVKDIYFGLINDTDYNYFTNDRIISTLVSVAWENHKDNLIIVGAINDYISKLAFNQSPYNPNILEERMRATNIQTRANRQAYVWGMIYQHFDYVAKGIDTPQNILKYIQGLNREDIINL